MVNPGEHTKESTRRKVLAAMGGAGTLALAGCIGGDDDDGDDGDDGADRTGEPDEDLTGEISIAVGANPDTLDPTLINDAPSQAVYGHVYEYLVTTDYDGITPVPVLATDWERSDDDLTWTFDLRDDVVFHNGDEFVADDVAFSIERARGTINDTQVDAIEDVEVIDDHTIEMTTTTVQAQFLGDLGGVPILPRNADGISEEPGTDDHDFAEESIGSGPFELELFQTEDRIELVPFEDHWADAHNPWEEVTFQVVEEIVSQEEAVRAGEVDAIDNPAMFDLDQWETEEPEVIGTEAVGFDLLGFPTQASPFSNDKMRRGLAGLVPREEVLTAVYDDNGVPISAPISPGLGPFYDADYHTELAEEHLGTSEEESLALIEEALDEEGIEPPIEIEMRTNINEERERWMEVIQQTWDETDYLNTSLEIFDFPSLVEFIEDPDGLAAAEDIVIGIGWTGGSDPNGHIEDLYHSSNVVPDGNNWSMYESDEADELIEQGQNVVDTDERVDIYRDLQDVLAGDSPHAWMWTTDNVHVVRTDAVEGWTPHPNSSFRFDSIYAHERDIIARPTE